GPRTAGARGRRRLRALAQGQPRLRRLPAEPARAAQDAGAAGMSERRRFRVSVQDVLVVGLAGVVIAQAVLFIRMERGRPPEIVTVGVRQITQEYVAGLATSEMSPEEARIRTELYLAVAQDTIRRMSVDKDVLVVARECVLAGEHADLTAQA